jgi:hypothetical protein
LALWEDYPGAHEAEVICHTARGARAELDQRYPTQFVRRSIRDNRGANIEQPACGQLINADASEADHLQ